MNLLIDSGNSCIKWALAKDESFILESSCPSKSAQSLYERWKNYDTPARVIVSNVAGQGIASEIKKATTRLWLLDAEFLVSSHSSCGLTNSYHKPEQLGIDRWMAMVAAYQITKGPFIVLDCGTAITIDRVDENGLFVGGIIMPGLNIAFQSLRAETDAVDEIYSHIHDVTPVAKSTEEAVAAGVLLGTAGGIERVVKDQSSEVDKLPVLYFTGGDAAKILPHLTLEVILQPDLVLQGLRIIATQRSEI